MALLLFFFIVYVMDYFPTSFYRMTLNSASFLMLRLLRVNHPPFGPPSFLNWRSLFCITSVPRAEEPPPEDGSPLTRGSSLLRNCVPPFCGVLMSGLSV